MAAAPAYPLEAPVARPEESSGQPSASRGVAGQPSRAGESSAQPSDEPAEEVIDLVAADAAVGLAPEPDAVDHVLQALINRARFKQVDVEEVATELVERSDLQGDEVSDVLASLVGRADADVVRPSSELTLFNDAVPSRPGQLTDFAKLDPDDKKRIIVRVLCLLVARSEDQQLPPRVETGGARNQSWPLARAVWPVAGDGERRRGPIAQPPPGQVPLRRGRVRGRRPVGSGRVSVRLAQPARRSAAASSSAS